MHSLQDGPLRVVARVCGRSQQEEQRDRQSIGEGQKTIGWTDQAAATW